MTFPVPVNESERLKKLKSLKILDTGAALEFDDLTRLAAQICKMPISIISLVDADRQWLKSKVGIDITETSREVAFCAHTILENDLLIVPNAAVDERFAGNPLVTGDPNIRFYAGAPLITSEGFALGSLCVIDRVPRELLPEQKDALAALARQAMKMLNLHQQKNELASANRKLSREIFERKIVERKLRHNALHDDLTDLPNRALFLEHLRHAIERNGNRGRKNFAVLFLDFDHFKVINDSLGHLEGDKLLQLIAQRLTNSLRPGDIVARLGGDEFTILLDDLGNPDDVKSIIERIQNNLKPSFNLKGSEVFISASIGIALSDASYTNPENMVRDADIAMYRAKAAGKAQYQTFDPTMHDQATRRLQLETELRQALQRDEFRLFYQPIINLQTGRIKGFESLVRWFHPTRGIIPPLEFIPVAEETGIIIPLGEWILRESCQQLCRWQNDYPSNPPLTMSVNLSGKQFLQTNLVERVVEILHDTKIETSSLRLEITESYLIEDSEKAIEIVNRLHSAGIKLSIDDFGTGYSSLSYLHRLSVSYLKIDRSFVSQMQNNAENREIVRTIISLAKNLDLGVIAEGIETIEQSDYLKSLECNFGQGYLYSKPVEAREAEQLITTHFPTGISTIPNRIPELISAIHAN